MITVKIKDKSGLEIRQLPSHWGEVIYRDLDHIEGKDTAEILAYYLGIEPEQVWELDNAVHLMLTLGFLQTPCEPLPHECIINVAQSEWSKLERVRQKMMAGESYYQVAALIVKTYLQIDLLVMPVTQSLSIALYGYQRVAAFLEGYAEMSRSYLTDKERAALYDPDLGHDYTEDLGFFPTLHALAKGDVTKYEQVLSTPAITVMNTLLVDYRTSKMQRRLQQMNQS